MTICAVNVNGRMLSMPGDVFTRVFRTEKITDYKEPTFQEVECTQCKNTFVREKRRIYAVKNVFCSLVCYRTYQAENREKPPVYCEKFNGYFKFRVRSFFNNSCYVCNANQEELRETLHVHHVNYNKQTCCNDDIPLFVPLCNSCHAKTNSNREEWKEYFTRRLMQEHGMKCYYTTDEVGYDTYLQRTRSKNERKITRASEFSVSKSAAACFRKTFDSFEYPQGKCKLCGEKIDDILYLRYSSAGYCSKHCYKYRKQSNLNTNNIHGAN